MLFPRVWEDNANSKKTKVMLHTLQDQLGRTPRGRYRSAMILQTYRQNNIYLNRYRGPVPPPAWFHSRHSRCSSLNIWLILPQVKALHSSLSAPLPGMIKNRQISGRSRCYRLPACCPTSWQTRPHHRSHKSPDWHSCTIMTLLKQTQFRWGFQMVINQN